MKYSVTINQHQRTVNMQMCYLIINLQYYLKILRELEVNILRERGSADERLGMPALHANKK